MRVLFDIETNGLLDSLTKVHCIAINVWCEEEITLYCPDQIEDALDVIANADEIVAHNGITFDIPALQKLYPNFKTKARCFDTLVASRLIWAHIKERDFKTRKRTGLPKKLIGSHSLEAWGYRLNSRKGDFGKGCEWSVYTDAMGEYCQQDVRVTADLLTAIEKQNYSERALILEHDLAELMWKQEQNGFVFNDRAAAALYAKLCQERNELKQALINKFKGWEVRTKFTPQVNNRPLGYVKGVETEKVKWIDFNPTSRQHIAKILMERYGWVPTQFGESGWPTVDEDVLSSLALEPAKDFAHLFLLTKRLGQLSEGKQGWLKVSKDGKIHGRVIGNGAVTGRCTHQSPNLAQVPSVGSIYGPECRELFGVPEGWKLVGSDMSNLELRCLAHYMSRYDGGSYTKTLLDGDIHTLNQQAAGLPTRDSAKTFIFGFLYGAGAAKIGAIVGGSAKHGQQLINKFLNQTPALKRLREGVKRACARGWIKGLDGRCIYIRSNHAALNSLLQGAGAVICKTWAVEVDRNLKAKGLDHGKDYRYSAFIHDELQIAAREDVAQVVADTCIEMAPKIGEMYDFKCRLAAEAKIGNNWRETH